MNDPENIVTAIYRAVDWINGELRRRAGAFDERESVPLDPVARRLHRHPHKIDTRNG